ncbi:hypothetical protein CTE05_34170 [Cellulomonas terrae]|uniref:Uncharacterized protein n=1 Tax=Cellulomonas terrae TaxID=311234 RepID=A0A511JPB3_9CELL|nr:hypothetical protein CTE05_34170 [Cellulomonas terrae]
MSYSTANVWATHITIGAHDVRQLLVPDHDDFERHGSGTDEVASSTRGTLAVSRGQRFPEATN